MYFEVSRWTSTSSAPSPFQPPTAICIGSPGIVCGVAARHCRIVGWPLHPDFLLLGGFWPIGFDFAGPPVLDSGIQRHVSRTVEPIGLPVANNKEARLRYAPNPSPVLVSRHHLLLDGTCGTSAGSHPALARHTSCTYRAGIIYPPGNGALSMATVGAAPIVIRSEDGVLQVPSWGTLLTLTIVLGRPGIQDTMGTGGLGPLEIDPQRIALTDRRTSTMMVIGVAHLQKRERIRHLFHQAEICSETRCAESRRAVPRPL